MAMQDLLSQDEIDALLHGVDDGLVETESGIDPESVRSYDLTSREHVVRGRLPTLELINERFTRYTRVSLFNLLRASVEVTQGALEPVKFSEYIESLQQPISLSLVKVKPLRGLALFLLDAKLLFKLVDSFFGGDGRQVRAEDTEFTPTELRMARLLVEQAFTDLVEAWQAVMPVSFEYLHGETNPAMANIADPNELVLVSSFHIDLEGDGGDLQIVLPYTMIEPVREMLDAGVQADPQEQDARWISALQEDILDVRVPIDATVVRRQLKLRDILHMQPGDVIPVELPEHMIMRANGVPTFKAKLGSHKGSLALQIVDRLGINAE